MPATVSSSVSPERDFERGSERASDRDSGRGLSASAAQERRAAPRVPVRWAVKLTPVNSGVRYLAGWADNVSAGGALIRLRDVTGPGRLRPGQRVRLGFAGVAGPALLAAERMIEAIVVRSAGDDSADRARASDHHLAVRFATPQALDICRVQLRHSA